MEANAAPLRYIRSLIQGFEVMYSKVIRKLERRHQLWLLLEAANRTSFQDDELYTRWRDERLGRENAESMIREVDRYMERQDIVLHTLENDLRPLKFLLKEGRTLEDHVRAQLSLHISGLSLEESRKSIEESKRSMKQPVAMNRLNVLAFFFLPWSLITSFFGMNVKEISGSGASLKAFLISAGDLTVLVLLVWVSLLCFDHIWEAFQSLRRKEQQNFSQNSVVDVEKGNAGVGKDRKGKHLTWSKFWAELKPKIWLEATMTTQELPVRTYDFYKAYLEEEEEEEEADKKNQ